MLQGVPRNSKSSSNPQRGGGKVRITTPVTSTHHHVIPSKSPQTSSPQTPPQCYRRPPKNPSPYPTPPTTSMNRNSAPPFQVRRKSDGKPVYLNSPAIGRVVVPYGSSPSVKSKPTGKNFVLISSLPSSYGWFKNLLLLLFGILLLFEVFAAVLAIFPSDHHSHDEHGNGDDDDEEEEEKRERGIESIGKPFPKQSSDGTCPPGFRPYFSGCILNMPFPRAVDETIKNLKVNPCDSLNAYACGGWRKYDKDRGSRSFHSAGLWNQRLS